MLLSTESTTPHPILRGDVLQSVFSHLPLADLRQCALVCRNFYVVTLRNDLWRRMWLTLDLNPPLRDYERALLESYVTSFGHQGFLRNLLLRRAPLMFPEEKDQAGSV